MLISILYIIFSFLLILASWFPLVPNQHWLFRVCEFARIQILTMAVGATLTGFLIPAFFQGEVRIVQIGLLLSIAYHLKVLGPYIPLFQKKIPIAQPADSATISVLSVNVYQFNTNYQPLIDLVEKVNPDILLTMESNMDWEKALSVIESDYPYHKKVALENTYGIHFYSKIETEEIKVNYLVADDLPSIEAHLKTADQQRFTLFGLHPPPPSPTESQTSKERDGELMIVAKKAKTAKDSVVVVGDFNNVTWSKASILFRKTSELLDPRIGRGFVSTYHAKYPFFQFPIDLFFHSTDVVIKCFKTLGNIGSDHLPLYCEFYLHPSTSAQNHRIETLEKGEREVVDEWIEKGIEEEEYRPEVAEEDTLL